MEIMRSFEANIYALAYFAVVGGCFATELNYSELDYYNGLYYHPVSSVPYTGKTLGLVRSQIVDGKYNGPYEQYFINGKLRTKGQYKFGKRQGLWISYHPNGQLHSKGLFENGRWEGLWVDYYDDGHVRSRGLYVNGVRIKSD